MGEVVAAEVAACVHEIKEADVLTDQHFALEIWTYFKDCVRVDLLQADAWIDFFRKLVKDLLLNFFVLLAIWNLQDDALSVVAFILVFEVLNSRNLLIDSVVNQVDDFKQLLASNHNVLRQLANNVDKDVSVVTCADRGVGVFKTEQLAEQLLHEFNPHLDFFVFREFDHIEAELSLADVHVRVTAVDCLPLDPFDEVIEHVHNVFLVGHWLSLLIELNRSLVKICQVEERGLLYLLGEAGNQSTHCYFYFLQAIRQLM